MLGLEGARGGWRPGPLRVLALTVALVRRAHAGPCHGPASEAETRRHVALFGMMLRMWRMRENV